MLVKDAIIAEMTEAKAQGSSPLKVTQAALMKDPQKQIEQIDMDMVKADTDYAVVAYNTFTKNHPELCISFLDTPQNFWKEKQGDRALGHMPSYLCIEATSTESDCL
ncbi:hypothetical protein BGW38_001473, partial [Lunasporangiospora selenospora]